MIPEDQRVMPATRPDEEGLSHKSLCTCEVCIRPGMAEEKRRWWSRQVKAGVSPRLGR